MTGHVRVRVGDTIGVALAGSAYAGSVADVENDDGTPAVVRVITIQFHASQQIDEFDRWVPWKGYLVEDPAGKHRFTLLESDGERLRTTAFDDVLDVEVFGEEGSSSANSDGRLD